MRRPTKDPYARPAIQTLERLHAELGGIARPLAIERGRQLRRPYFSSGRPSKFALRTRT